MSASSTTDEVKRAEAKRFGERWIGIVGGRKLLDARGNFRLFLNEEAALRAAHSEELKRRFAKLCGRCQRTGRKVWIYPCRICGKGFCEHLCHLKTEDGTAICGTCKK